MQRNQLIDITSNKYSVNTCESYSNGCFFYDGDLLIPYMNLEILDGKSIGFVEERGFLDFSFLLLRNCSSVQWYDGSSAKDGNVGAHRLLESRSGVFDYFGMTEQSQGWEVKTMFTHKLFLVPDYAQMDIERFSPWDTPAFRKDMDEVKVWEFSNLRLLPNALSRFQNAARLNFSPGTKEEIKIIKMNW